MKNLLFIILAFATLQSCDDGDVIVTTFDFEDADLNLCNNDNQYVFYKINNTVSESISLKITTDDQLFLQSETKTFKLDGSANIVNYRRFNGDVTGDYFCSTIPPTSPTVAVDYTGASGTASLNTTTALDDNDGVENETGDTDGDGIPDSYDFDDDGDNVPTAAELDTANEDGDNDPLTNPLDTDGDGTPDYLDTDDDGDGIFTIYEDKNLNLNPLDDITDPEAGPDYLNSEIAVQYDIQLFRQHTYTFDSDVVIRLTNLVLVNGEEQITQESLSLGSIESVLNGEFTPTPNFVAPE